MNIAKLGLTKEGGLKRYGFLKAYTVNQIQVIKEGGGIYPGISYGLKIGYEGKILFSGGMSIGPGNIYRQIDEEDFDNLLPVMERLRVSRLSFDFEVYDGTTLQAKGEIEVVDKPSRKYLVTDAGENIMLEASNGVLLEDR